MQFPLKSEIKRIFSENRFVSLSSLRKAGRGWSGPTPLPPTPPGKRGETQVLQLQPEPRPPAHSLYKMSPPPLSLTQPMTKRPPSRREVEPRGRKLGSKRNPTCYGSLRLFLISTLRPALTRLLPFTPREEAGMQEEPGTLAFFYLHATFLLAKTGHERRLEGRRSLSK